MTTKMTTATVSGELKKQREYTAELEKRTFSFSLIIADAFIRGMRDIGYKHTGTALDELIDNALQAGASKVHTVLGFEGESGAKPAQIAIIDDGHGMDPMMIRAAMVWGGTHRENDRGGFGRYGYGLPSASVSQGQCFSVYSIVEGGELNVVTLDIERIADYKDETGQIVVPAAQRTTLPSFVSTYISKHFGGGLTHGTIVVIEKLDRLTWLTASALERNLLQHFGVTYRNFIPAVTVAVQGKKVRPIDPLFIAPGAQFFDIDEDRAEPLKGTTFEVKDQETRKPLGMVKVRYSYLPPTFARVDKSRAALGANQNKRFAVMADHNGIIITRSGRQIDVVSKGPTVFRNDDRYVNVEVDFEPSLDHLFSITTSKQQIVVSDRMWDLLKDQGVFGAITKMRARWKEESASLVTKQEEDPTERRASEGVMEDTEKLKSPPSAGDRIEQEKESERRLNEEIRRRAEQFKLPLEEAQRRVEAETQGNPYVVKHESVPGGPFYRPDQVGGQKILWLNRSHAFFTEVYAGRDATPHVRTGLELLLWAPVELELNATGELDLFYRSLRSHWSTGLDVLLGRLSQLREVDEPPPSESEEVEEGSSEAEEAPTPIGTGSGIGDGEE